MGYMTAGVRWGVEVMKPLRCHHVFYTARSISLQSGVSSSVFRHRFHVLHPTPLLGRFFHDPRLEMTPDVLAFAPANLCDTDKATALCGGDFFLTSLHVIPDQELYWDIIDCCCDRCLFQNTDEELLAMLNPLGPTRWILD
jgi:hypothetical protein